MTSLHTKYRPARFEDVIGQEVAVSSLKKAIANQRARAFILSGPSGTGKTTLARIIINTATKGKATAANLDEVDAAKYSSVNDTRALVNRCLYKALGESPIKAFIIDEAHRLSGSAWDTLLKPIEEPPSHVYWVLCTTEPGKIPKTIQTRCLKYDLKPVAEELIVKLLTKVVDAEGFVATPEIIEAIAEEANGSPRQALVHLEACADCQTVLSARAIMRAAGQSKEVRDFCQFLIKQQGRNWAAAIKLIKAIPAEPESIRINVVNYLAAVLMNTNGDRQAAGLLELMECFNTPYLTSDKQAPLLRSIGLALGMDQQ